ncbi:MAG: hypothetical protein ABI172_08080 [Ginsengibacter sp.]|jgi:hypothetical protein
MHQSEVENESKNSQGIKRLLVPKYEIAATTEDQQRWFREKH